MKPKSLLYTLVRHTAWSVKQDPYFERGVETRAVEERYVGKILSCGGLIFTSYTEADRASYNENYPDPEDKSFCCKATGSFLSIAKIPEEIYIPKVENHV